MRTEGADNGTDPELRIDSPVAGEEVGLTTAIAVPFIVETHDDDPDSRG